MNRKSGGFRSGVLRLSRFASTLLAFTAISMAMQSARAETTVEPKRQAFQTRDGVILVGDVYAQGTKAPTVILWHQLGRTRADLQWFIPLLLGKGFSVVNMDLRGHGESVNTIKNTKIDYKTFTGADWLKLPEDVPLIVQDLKPMRHISGSLVGIVGCSIGANMAAMDESDPNVKAVVMLSPGYDYHGLKPEPQLRKSTKPIFMVAAKPDEFSYDAIQRWANKKPNLNAAVVSQSAHGDDLLKNERVTDQVVDFLVNNLHK
ncbi:MAG TPA: alpha/beta fold hydrolase [Planktothrix sp.]|jgi:alpha-beta hydrolase superfamily lysophospholipase